MKLRYGDRSCRRCLRCNYQALINSWSVPHIAGDLALDLIGGFPVQFCKFAALSRPVLPSSRFRATAHVATH